MILNFLKNSKINPISNVLAVIATLAVYSWYISENKVTELYTELVGQKEKFTKLTEYSASLGKQYATQQEITKRLQREWDVERNNLRGRVKILSNATYLIRERARRQNTSDIEYKGGKVKYLFNEIRFKDGPPVGYVLIFDDGRVVSKIYNHKFDVKTLVSREDETGKYDILSKAFFVLRSGHLKTEGKNWFNVPYPLRIDGGTATIDPVERLKVKKKFIWAKQLNANINFTSKPAAGFGLSLAGYGVSKRDLDFKFLQLGAQYSTQSEVGLTVTPAMWRFAPNLLPNTYLGPGYYVDKDNSGYFVGLQIGL